MPFSVEQFLGVFERYNAGVWPMQVLLMGLGWWALAAADGRVERGERWASGILAFLWAWMGVVYHLRYFTAINWAAWVFGGVFLTQAALFLDAALRGGLDYRAEDRAGRWTGAVLAAYGLWIYPMLGLALGQEPRQLPTFGLPCPTTIFTLGLLLRSGRAPATLWLIPAGWSLVGTSAFLQLGMAQDLGLPLALLAAMAVSGLRKLPKTPPGRPAPPRAGAGGRPESERKQAELLSAR